MGLPPRRRERRLEAFVAASDLPKSPGHPFYTALNRLLAANHFDSFVEKLCAPNYAEAFRVDRAFRLVSSSAFCLWATLRVSSRTA